MVFTNTRHSFSSFVGKAGGIIVEAEGVRGIGVGWGGGGADLIEP